MRIRAAHRWDRYVKTIKNRHGKGEYFYFAYPGRPLVHLPRNRLSREFVEAYFAALAAVENNGPPAVGASRTVAGSVNAAIAGFYQSRRFREELAPSTRAVTRNILERFREKYGDLPISRLEQRKVAEIIEPMGPIVARSWIKVLRRLITFAIEKNMMTANPTTGLKLPKVVSDGHHTWTEEEIAAFEERHPIGSKARLAMALMLFTCQRRGDAVRMGRQHVRGGLLFVRQEKTGKELHIPLHPDLSAILTASRNDHMTFLVTDYGRPFTAAGFGNWFRDRCNEAGLKHCSAHGLRKAACRRLAEAGCSEKLIASLSGHETLKEVERYTKAADQRRMAIDAMARQVAVEGENRTRTGKLQPEFSDNPSKSLKNKET